MHCRMILAGILTSGLCNLVTQTKPATPSLLVASPHENMTTIALSSSSVVKTGHQDPVFECGEYTVADDAVVLMAKSLSRVKGRPPSNDAHQCGQVACYYKAAISWCNDSDEYMVLPDWLTLAKAARAIAVTCRSNDTRMVFGHSTYHMLSGKVSYPEGYSLVVKGGQNC